MMTPRVSSSRALVYCRGLFAAMMVVVLVPPACSRPAEAARFRLAQMGLPYTGSAFLQSIREGHDLAVGLYLDAGMSLETRTDDDQSPLMVAALAGRTEMLRLLLARGADPDARDKFGGTALMTAAWKGQAEAISALLQRGARPDLQARNGMTALMFAVWENHPEGARRLLDHGARLELRDADGRTALLRAAFKGHVECVRLLLERGADPRSRADDGRGALGYAGGHAQVAELLRAGGAKATERDLAPRPEPAASTHGKGHARPADSSYLGH